MSSPWLRLPLTDYEGHMSAPNVGQANLLADVLESVLSELRPATVAVIGCAGGNGFDRIDPLEVARVVGTQSNPEFGAVELVYAALVFEYVDVPSALRNLFLACRHGGHLVALLQLPSNAAAAVTHTAFTSIQTLSASLKLVDPVAFEEMAQKTGFALRRATRVVSGAGKEFAVQVYQRPPV